MPINTCFEYSYIFITILFIDEIVLIAMNSAQLLSTSPLHIKIYFLFFDDPLPGNAHVIISIQSFSLSNPLPSHFLSNLCPKNLQAISNLLLL